MGLMALNLATLNVRGLRDLGKCTRLLGELKTLGVNVAAVPTDVDVVFAGEGGRLVVADVAVKSFKFRLAAVYVPNIVVERVSFFRQLAPFLDDTKRLVLMGD